MAKDAKGHGSNGKGGGAGGAVKVLNAVRGGAVQVHAIAKTTGLKPAAVAGHLENMRADGLVKARFRPNVDYPHYSLVGAAKPKGKK